MDEPSKDMINVAFLSLFNYEVKGLDACDLNNYLGGNSGNLLFRDCIYNMLDFKNINLYDFFKINNYSETNKKKIKILFIGCANLISNNQGCIKYTQFLIDVIKETENHTQIVLISLGQQLPLDFDFNTLNEVSIAFIKLITSRIKKILVRDPLTLKIINYYKENECDVIVTGCPSIFNNININQNQHLDNNLSNFLNKINKPSDSLVKLDILYSPQVINDKIYEKTIKLINNLFSNCQINVKLLIADYYSLNEENRLKYKNELFYSSVKEVFTNYKPDIVISNRIHSGILSLEHNFPTIIVYHDSRTKLLSEVFKIPNISYTEVENFSISKLNELKYDSYCKNKIEISKEYIKYFNEIGVPISKFFENFDSQHTYHNYTFPKWNNR